MGLGSHVDTTEGWKVIGGHRDIYYANKSFNYFICVEVRNIEGKLNIYESHIFPRSLDETS